MSWLMVAPGGHPFARVCALQLYFDRFHYLSLWYVYGRLLQQHHLRGLLSVVLRVHKCSFHDLLQAMPACEHVLDVTLSICLQHQQH
jgi:hypothetical protein